MSFDPRDLDFGGDEVTLPPRPVVERDAVAGAAPPEETDTDPYVELLLREAANGDTDRPYLATVPEDVGVEETIFDWLDHLVSRAGVTGASEAIDRYEELGWVGEAAAADLHDYLLGVGTTGDPDADGLDRRDHVESLVYVAKLASGD